MPDGQQNQIESEPAIEAVRIGRPRTSRMASKWRPCAYEPITGSRIKLSMAAPGFQPVEAEIESTNSSVRRACTGGGDASYTFLDTICRSGRTEQFAAWNRELLRIAQASLAGMYFIKASFAAFRLTAALSALSFLACDTPTSLVEKTLLFRTRLNRSDGRAESTACKHRFDRVFLNNATLVARERKSRRMSAEWLETSCLNQLKFCQRRHSFSP